MTFGEPRRHLELCASTNDLARAWAADPQDPAPHGALVTARFQTRGRGRRGHGWEAAAGENALMSFVLRPCFPLQNAWQLGFVGALAVADALAAWNLTPRLKWPNDVLWSGNKIAGVLAETLGAPNGWAAVVGIGVNVNQAGWDDAALFACPPTSLRIATGQACVVEDVIQEAARALAQRAHQHAQEGFGPILQSWQARLALGMPLQRGRQHAILTGLAPDGRARVRLSDGTFTEWATVEGEVNADGV